MTYCCSRPGSSVVFLLLLLSLNACVCEAKRGGSSRYRYRVRSGGLSSTFIDTGSVGLDVVIILLIIIGAVIGAVILCALIYACCETVMASETSGEAKEKETAQKENHTKERDTKRADHSKKKKKQQQPSSDYAAIHGAAKSQVALGRGDNTRLLRPACPLPAYDATVDYPFKR